MSVKRTSAMGHWTMVKIPIRPKPKARPRVTANGTFMPPDYRAWIDEFAQLIRTSARLRRQITGPVHLEVGFGSDDITLQLYDADHHTRPKGVTGDLDNLVGAVMDGLQAAGILGNDRQVVVITAHLDGGDGDVP